MLPTKGLRQDKRSGISVVIAALNEEKGIGPTINEMRSFLQDFHLIVVDGNSSDKTIEIAKNFEADILLQEGKGKGDALLQGIRAIKEDSIYVVLTDADFTYPAEYVPKMIAILEHDPKVGMVTGNRFGTRDRMATTKNPFYIGNKILAFTEYVINAVDLEDPLSGLRVVRADILRNWQPRSKGFDIEAELNSYVRRKGFKTIEVYINYRQRIGKKKLGLRHGLIILKRILAG